MKFKTSSLVIEDCPSSLGDVKIKEKCLKMKDDKDLVVGLGLTGCLAVLVVFVFDILNGVTTHVYDNMYVIQ